MSIKDCFSKRWISYELSRSCTSKDCIKAVEKAYAMRFQSYLPVRPILRTDNGPQYAAKEFRESMKFMGIASYNKFPYMKFNEHGFIATAD